MIVQLVDRDPARLRDRLQGGPLGAAAPALPRPRRRAQPDGPHLRLADAARPRGTDQRGAACSIGIINQPIDALLFSQFAVILVLSTSYLTYTVIPIYGAMKAIDKQPVRGRAATSAPAGGRRSRRVLLPLIAPGHLRALLLVYVPLFTDFASPALVGGTSGYMLGKSSTTYVLESGDLERRCRGEPLHAGAVGDSSPSSPTSWRKSASSRRDRANGGGQYDAVIVGGGPQRPRRRLLPGSRRPAALIVCERRDDRRRRLRHRGVRARLPRLDRRLRAQHAARAGLARPAAGRARDRGRRRRPGAQPVRRRLARCSSTTTSRRRRTSSALLARRRPGAARVRGRARPSSPTLIGPLFDTTPAGPAATHRRRAAVRCSSWPASRARNRRRISDALLSVRHLRARSPWPSTSSPTASKAALGWHAINDSTAGPSTPGTAYVLLHDHASEQAGGGIRPWGFVRGGIGRRHRGDGRRGARGGRRDPHRGAGRAGPRRRRPRRRASSSSTATR